ncbi:MAG: 3-keto-5-aminohexanoate cleavage protein [Saprospirales bacterium]|nr:3-keto-5-aminohexanoate cleavage protein [Saprospirales bacterium]
MNTQHKLVLNFTPTGMVPTKAMTPMCRSAFPEIVEQVHAALQIGITLVHLHAPRYTSGEPKLTQGNLRNRRRYPPALPRTGYLPVAERTQFQ